MREVDLEKKQQMKARPKEISQLMFAKTTSVNVAGGAVVVFCFLRAGGHICFNLSSKTSQDRSQSPCLT